MYRFIFTSSLCILLFLPNTSSAVFVKSPKPSHLQKSIAKYASSSSKKGSSSSKDSLVTIRHIGTGITFKIPSSWKVEYLPEGIRASLSHSADPAVWPTYLWVYREPSSKKQSIKLLYNTFLDHSTIQSTSQNPLGIDWYTPSFQLSASGAIQLQGADALSLKYKGELMSTAFVAHGIIISTDRWTYTIDMRALPQYAERDAKVFEGVVGSWGVEGGGKSASSVGMKRIRK